MQLKTLGRSDIRVTDLCLGTMTWGSQTSEAEAHAQIDMALDRGVNMIDTAEMYPVNPVRAETVGRTETILGNWIARSGRRDAIVLATKISGPNRGFVRDGEKISSAAIVRALDASLRRLQTDVIDLYQFHWPNRGSYAFRQNWDYDPFLQNPAETRAHMEDALGELQRQVDAGKIRQFGLSNESAWGAMAWLRTAAVLHGPRVATLQNEYSLLSRMFDTDLAEVAANEDVGLLAFSPLAAGLLTGKYRGGAVPLGSRMSLNGDLGGRATPRAHQAVEAYLEVARRHGLDPVQMAVAFCRSRPFVTSAILGATSAAQLEVALGAADLALGADVLADISATHRKHPMPY
ncbi:MAG: aldo/keto reductase [Rhodobacteraceae bacterium]|nr:aldo/keto reductase [Paracoccaceae bacterium]